MGRVATITRRTLLVGAAAVAGGVAFGVWRYRTPYANPLLDELDSGEAAITPYVKIDADGVTLITPRADKGQGVYHIQAALLAEELDVDLDQVRVDPGPPSRAYWNTALATEAADFMVPSAGMMQNAATVGLSAVMKFIGMQITGGSTTVPDQFEKLRIAGAVARETLKAAAAKQAGVSVSRLTTQSGTVILPDGSRMTYSELAPVAATIDPVEEVTLRDPSQWRLLGKPMQRIDMVAKCTGTQVYGIDEAIEGMVHATVLLNPAQGGAINGFDAREAGKMRGVKAVVPVTGGVGIVADNTWRAFQAAKAVKADWGKAAFPATMDEHWQTLADSFIADRQDSRNRDDGDVEIAIAESAPVEAEYRAPYLAHAPLEPISAIVRVADDAVDVWTGTQIPRFTQANVARITGIDAEKVRVHVYMMGGSFGHRLEDEVVKQAAEIAVQMKGTPVKLTYSREEDMTHDFVRQIAMARLRGTVRDGRVETLDLGIAMPAVMASQLSR
ncbi:MAG: molybdopterin cofactor-binding domain-containing protein, partial [Zhengella sp.]|uniref:molybdopterin cofactor-binding domain-containing protein n=1 Tax=Zhengella sp. TaxID=2282762 RepID=UPI00352953B1